MFRQKGSAFPDLICLGSATRSSSVQDDLGSPIIVECKMRKYLTPDEKTGLASFSDNAESYVVYPEPCPNDLRKTLLIFARPDDYHIVLRLEAQ